MKRACKLDDLPAAENLGQLRAHPCASIPVLRLKIVKEEVEKQRADLLGDAFSARTRY